MRGFLIIAVATALQGCGGIECPTKETALDGNVCIDNRAGADITIGYIDEALTLASALAAVEYPGKTACITGTNGRVYGSRITFVPEVDIDCPGYVACVQFEGVRDGLGYSYLPRIEILSTTDSCNLRRLVVHEWLRSLDVLCDLTPDNPSNHPLSCTAQGCSPLLGVYAEMLDWISCTRGAEGFDG